MNIDALRDLPDEEFEQVVLQAVKRRTDFPEWWRAVLHTDLIDDTEQAIRKAQDAAYAQSLTPERYPRALGFARKLDGILAEITLARTIGVN